MERKVGKINYRIVGKMFFVLCAALLSLYYAVDCKAVSWPFSNGNSLENACLWVRDDGYYFTPDISADEVEKRTITNEHVTDMWPEEDWIITGNNCAFAGSGERYFSEDENEKYLYFFTNINIDSYTGTLNYISKDELSLNNKTSQSIVVDDDVSIKGDFLVQDDGDALYQKWSDVGNFLYYFDGERSFQIAENIYRGMLVKLDRNIAYYVRCDENSECYTLYAKDVNNIESEKKIATDFYWIENDGERREGDYYFNDGNVFYVRNNNLCMNSYNSEEVIISNNIGEIISVEKNEIIYTKYVRNLKLTDYIDFSESEYSAEDFETLNFVETGTEDQLGCVQIYSYDVEKQDEKVKLENKFWGIRLEGKECSLGRVQNNIYILEDVDTFPENSEKILLNDIVSAECLNNREQVMASLEEWRQDQLGVIMNSKSVKLCLVTFKDEIKVYQLDTLKLLDCLEGDIGDISVIIPFDYEHNAVVIENDRQYIVNLTDEGIVGENDTYLEGIQGILIIGEKLICFQNNSVYWYNNGQCKYLGEGQNCEHWKGYEDGSILLLITSNKLKYGGTLWYIDENNTAWEIDSEVKKFAKLESGGLVYLAGNNLILYEDGIKTWIADHVNSFRLFDEKEKTETRDSAW